LVARIKDDHNIHAEASRCFFQHLALELQGVHYGHLTYIALVTWGTGDFDLLDGNHLTNGSVESKVDTSEVAVLN